MSDYAVVNPKSRPIISTVKNKSPRDTKFGGVLVESPVESNATGKRVGRLFLDETRVHDLNAVEFELSSSTFDAVILRFPSSQVGFVESLSQCGLIAIQSDTLLYFDLDLTRSKLVRSNLDLRTVGPEQERSIELLVSDIFHDYKNHYAATEFFRSIDIAGAYREWVCSSLSDPNVEVQVLYSQESVPCALSFSRNHLDGVKEILLAGVIEAERRRGRYFDLMSNIAETARKEGIKTLRISTQSSNIAVMRIWVRLGFMPVASFDTVHVFNSTSQ